MVHTLLALQLTQDLNAHITALLLCHHYGRWTIRSKLVVFVELLGSTKSLSTGSSTGTFELEVRNAGILPANLETQAQLSVGY